jgi:hypothetical protein
LPRTFALNSVGLDLAAYANAIDAAARALQAGDRDTALAMLSGARAMLGVINELYAPGGLEASRGQLAAQDEIIATAMADVRKGKPISFRAIRQSDTRLSATLFREETGSYYDAATLARILGVDPPVVITDTRL